MFFKLLSVVEHWQHYNHYNIMLWKKYPEHSYQKYISGIWARQIRGKPVELAEYTRQKIERSHPTEPFPFMKLFINTLFMLLILPFIMISGLFLGPLYVYRKALQDRAQLQAAGASPQ